jgi:CHAT domain-containing protein/tetratricopeptide (TPR) repeat protein
MKRILGNGSAAVLLALGLTRPVAAQSGVDSGDAASDVLRNATIENEQASALFRAGKYAQALPFAERALALAREAVGPDDPRLLTYQLNLVALYGKVGQVVRQKAELDAYISLAERIHGPVSDAVAEGMIQLGSSQGFLGDDHAAEAACARAVDIYEHLATATAYQKSRAHNCRGMALGHLGKTGKSEAEFNRARTYLEGGTDRDSKLQLATVLTNLGESARRRGALVEAVEQLARALEIKTELSGWSHSSTLNTVNAIAVIVMASEGCERALPLLERASKAIAHDAGTNSAQAAATLSNLAACLEQVGQDVRAVALNRRVIAIKRQIYGDDSFEVAISMSNLGVALFKQGLRAEAWKLTEQAAAIAKSHPWREARTGAALQNLALFALATGDVARALRELAQAQDYSERFLTRVLALGTEDQKRDSMLESSTLTNLIVTTLSERAPANSVARELGLRAVLSRKRRVLDVLRSNRLQRAAPEVTPLFKQLGVAKARLSAIELAGGSKSSASELRAARRDVEGLEKEVASKTTQSEIGPGSVKQVQDSLVERAALLEYVRFSPVGPPGSTSSNSQARYGVFVLRKTGAPAWADLGPATAIEAESRAFVAAAAAQSPESEGHARTLGRLLIAPVAEQLHDIDLLHISPDGLLNIIPFSALSVDARDPLITSVILNMVMSGRDLVRYRETPPPAVERPLVLVSPDYGVPRGEVSKGVDRPLFTALKHTTAEGEAVAGLLDGARLLSGSQATERAVRAVHGPSIMHLATHGFYIGPLSPVERGQPRGAPRRGLTLTANGEDMEEALTSSTMLARVGVALAGANLGAEDAEDDGILSGDDVSGLDLNGTALVVLSACETAVGGLAESEGVYGLHRALMVAGAQASMVSLWKVDDAATKELMVDVYRNLGRGAGRAEALRSAQLALAQRTATAHPAYWASFVAVGDWRPLDNSNESPPRVSPSSRGCSCRFVHEPSSGNFLSVLVAGVGLAIRRTRSSRRRNDQCSNVSP